MSFFALLSLVALLAEGVDRNPASSTITKERRQVALLAEGVDRNKITWDVQEPERVALLAEGVDRNQKGSLILVTGSSRPPRGGRG